MNDKYLKESIDVLNRKFGEPLPTLEDTMKWHKEQKLKELKFGSKAQYDKYKKDHIIKPGTEIEIDGKKMKEPSAKKPSVDKKVDKKIFPVAKIIKRINEHVSTPIIINAANEVLVEHFLRKKIPFLGIQKVILDVLKDKNYKKYAIRKPSNFNTINIVNTWAKNITDKKIKQFYG